jgi:hypothetical protein
MHSKAPSQAAAPHFLASTTTASKQAMLTPKRTSLHAWNQVRQVLLLPAVVKAQAQLQYCGKNKQVHSANKRLMQA